MSPQQPSFHEYQSALQRLRRRAHLRRAVMTRGVTNSIEMPILDEQEMADRELCDIWNERHGFFQDSY